VINDSASGEPSGVVSDAERTVIGDDEMKSFQPARIDGQRLQRRAVEASSPTSHHRHSFILGIASSTGVRAPARPTSAAAV